MPSVQEKLELLRQPEPQHEGPFPPDEEAPATIRIKVESGGKGVVAHVGLHALGSVADALGLGAALSSRLDYTNGRAPLHDRGKVIVQMALVLAGGGEELRRRRAPTCTSRSFR